MPGIIGAVNKNSIKDTALREREGLINESLVFEDIFLKRSTLPKFLDDKAFFETENFIFLIEGVVYNKSELIDKYNYDSWNNTLIEMSKSNSTFFNEFRGSFSGFFYNKNDKEAIIFTNHIGDKTIYYYENEGELLFASNINDILKLMIKNNIQYTLDKRGAYCLLTHGYMLEDLTPFKEIKRLKPGCYIKVKENTIKTVRYHLFDNTPNDNLTDDKEIIDKIDSLFRKAVARQVGKNKEYGYMDISSLSAGLDSRMTTWVVSQNMKTKDLLNITYSQSNFLDETIPKEISAELKTQLLFKPLDNGLSLFLLDEIVKRNAGLLLYGAPAQVWDMFHLLDHTNTGIVHSGLYTEVSLTASYFKKQDSNTPYSIKDGCYSTFLMDRLREVLIDFTIEDYKNQELFTLYNKGFNGMAAMTFTMQEFTETQSPGIDVDFANYCFTIPLEKRWKYYIYDKWVLDKYPDAAKYPHNERKITANKGRCYSIPGKGEFTLNELKTLAAGYLIRKVRGAKKRMETLNHMNPFDYWYNTNSELKEYMDNYYSETVDKIEDKTLKRDLVDMYEKGNTIEKTQVLTFLSLMKNYFFSTEWLSE